jgi:hypothetical protein
MGIMSKTDIVAEHGLIKKVRSHEICNQSIRLTFGNVVTEISEMEFFEARTKCLEKYANTLHILLIYIIEPESAHIGMQLAAQEAMEKNLK